jgi:hypothetical protein
MTQACGKSVSNHSRPEPFDAIAYDFHCINRCVRRSLLRGEDDYTNRRFEHRKPWVEKCILELGDIFACGIYSWTVMSNHLHIVKSINQQIRKAPERANQPLTLLIGVKSFNVPNSTERDYIELVDFTGREWHAGKRGRRVGIKK